MNALGDVKYTGNLHNNVYRLTNGHLLFAYWFFNDALSVDSVDRLSVTGFAGWGTNVDWASNAPPSGAAPVYADRSASGDTISFQFMPSLIGGNGLIEPGTNNFAVCIEVDAPNYALIGSTSTINGAVATVKTYAPVPEPTSLAILGIGIIGLAYRRNRR